MFLRVFIEPFWIDEKKATGSSWALRNEDDGEDIPGKQLVEDVIRNFPEFILRSFSTQHNIRIALEGLLE